MREVTFGLFPTCFLVSCCLLKLVLNEETCRTPSKKPGICVPLKSCQYLYKVFLDGPGHLDRFKYLQRSTCPSSYNSTDANEEPKVCCLPNRVSFFNNTRDDSEKVVGFDEDGSTTTPFPDHNSTTSSSLTTMKMKPTNQGIANHPNMKLLPDSIHCGNPVKLDRIVGGIDAGLGSFPWMALLGLSDRSGDVQFACGGTLINSKYVLTAAHCLKNLPRGVSVTVVRMGEYDQSSGIDCRKGLCAPPHQDMDIEEIIPHEKYNLKEKKENDIGLIRFTKAVRLGPFVEPICLPRGLAITNSTEKRKYIVAGWGRTAYDSPEGSQVLQMVQVPLVNMTTCNDVYKKEMGVFDSGRFCAGGESGKDSCRGDSGGPLMAAVELKSLSNHPPRYIQYGIVSIGPPRCGKTTLPAVYTKVSHFMPWILDHLKP